MNQRYTYFLFLIALFFALLPSPPCYAQVSTTTIDIPLYLNNTFIGNVDLDLSPQLKESFPVSSLEVLLHPKLNRQGLLVLDQIASKHHSIPASFYYQDFCFNYHPEEQTLHASIPVYYIKRLESSLKEKIIEPYVDPESIYYPSPISGMVDFSFDSRFYHFYYTQAPSFTNFNLGSNFYINLKNTLFDGYVYLIDYTGGAIKDIAKGINRGNFTLTRDFPHSNLRCKIGDLSPASHSFQNTLPMLGLNLLNSPRLFTNTSFSTTSQHEFILNSPSRVDIYVNGSFIKTLDLPAGPHLVKDFPFANGVNDVTLKITDAMGNINDLQLESLFIPLKISPGQFSFDATFGFPTFQEATQRFKYLFNRPALSTTFGIGVSDTLTAQCYVQAIKEGTYLGSSFLFYNKWAQTSFELGSSFTKNIPPGVRSRFSISNPQFSKKSPFSWIVNIDFISHYFSYFGSKTFTNKEKWLFSSSLGTAFPGYVNTSITGYYGIHRQAFANVWSLQHTLSKTFKYGSGSVVTSYRQLDNRNKVFEMVFNFSLNPQEKTRISSSYNTRSRTSSSITSYSLNPTPDQNINLSAGLATAKDNKNFTGSFLYQGARGNLSANHYLVESAVPPIEERPKISGTTHINGKTALFFAENTLCLGKPTASSFAIIKPMDMAKKYPLYINSSSYKAYQAKSSLSMGIVIPISNYTQTTLQVDSYEAPTGIEFNQQYYTAQTKNRSGVLVPVYATLFMCAQGYFVDSQNNPLSYCSGYLTFCDADNQEDKIFFFTNEYGKFALDGLRPGTYMIYFDQFKHKKITIKIKESKKLINLNKIIINLTK